MTSSTDIASRDRRQPMLATLMIASAISPLAINIFIPSMTSIAGALETDGATVSLGLSLYLFATAAIQLIAGPLSDRFGRRPVILAGMMLFLVGTLLCILAESVELFLAGRIIQSASATGLALSRAIVRDLFSRDKAASMIGYVTMGLAVAPMIGPAIGGWIDGVAGWRAVFWMLAVLGSLTLLLIYFDLSETNAERGRPMMAQFRSYGALFKTPNFWIYAGASSLTSAVYFAFLGGAPFVSVELLGMTPAGYGLWFILCAFGYIVGNFITGRLSERLGIKTMMVAGCAVTLAAALVATAFVLGGRLTAATLFWPMMFVGIGNGLALPSGIAGGVSVRPEAAGAAAGLLGALQIGLGALVTTLAAVLATHGRDGVELVLLMAVLAALGLLVAFFAKRERKPA